MDRDRECGSFYRLRIGERFSGLGMIPDNAVAFLVRDGPPPELIPVDRDALDEEIAATPGLEDPLRERFGR